MEFRKLLILMCAVALTGGTVMAADAADPDPTPLRDGARNIIPNIVPNIVPNIGPPVSARAARPTMPAPDGGATSTCSHSVPRVAPQSDNRCDSCPKDDSWKILNWLKNNRFYRTAEQDAVAAREARDVEGAVQLSALGYDEIYPLSVDDATDLIAAAGQRTAPDDATSPTAASPSTAPVSDVGGSGTGFIHLPANPLTSAALVADDGSVLSDDDSVAPWDVAMDKAGLNARSYYGKHFRDLGRRDEDTTWNHNNWLDVRGDNWRNYHVGGRVPGALGAAGRLANAGTWAHSMIKDKHDARLWGMIAKLFGNKAGYRKLMGNGRGMSATRRTLSTIEAILAELLLARITNSQSLPGLIGEGLGNSYGAGQEYFGTKAASDVVGGD